MITKNLEARERFLQFFKSRESHKETETEQPILRIYESTTAERKYAKLGDTYLCTFAYEQEESFKVDVEELSKTHPPEEISKILKQKYNKKIKGIRRRKGNPHLVLKFNGKSEYICSVPEEDYEQAKTYAKNLRKLGYNREDIRSQIIKEFNCKVRPAKKEDKWMKIFKQYCSDIKSLRCPKCNSPMRLKINFGKRMTRNRGLVYFGCTNYNHNSHTDCRYALQIDPLVYLIHQGLIDDFMDEDHYDYDGEIIHPKLPLPKKEYQKYLELMYDGTDN